MEDWLPVTVIFIYLAIVLYIGIFAFRKSKATGEDFFLANRSVGSVVFFLSLFATNMTAFAILGSSGIAYKRGIGVYGLMASSSGFIIPLTLLVIGTRLWGLGKRFGHMTQVQYFRDRWECSGIGTVIFLLTASLLIPYLIISITGGGTILEQLTHHKLSYEVGGAIVTLVVMGNVFFGGMRGAVLVNVFQTLLFLAFGTVAFVLISKCLEGAPAAPGLPVPLGLAAAVQKMAGNDKQVWALNRTRIPWREFLSYIFIPLSSIMFPHMSIMCLTAKKVTAFKKTVILYPLCIMMLWLPCVFLGALAFGQPRINAAIAADSPMAAKWLASGGAPTIDGKQTLTVLLSKVSAAQAADVAKYDAAKAAATRAATQQAGALKPGTAPAGAGKPAGAKPAAPVGPQAITSLLGRVQGKNIKSEELGRELYAVINPVKDPVLKPQLIAQIQAMANSSSTDSVLLQMLKIYLPAALAGILAAGIISAVMGSDCHQILALSTMFSKDIFDYYGGRKKYGDKATVYVARAFIVVANLAAYLVALTHPPIFELAVSWAFSGFAALAPVMLAALFWKRSTKWGALAAALFVAFGVIMTGVLEHVYAPYVPKGPTANGPLLIGGHSMFTLSANAGKLFIFGFMPVVPMVLGSALCVIVFSLISAPPSRETIDRYFGKNREQDATGAFPVSVAGT